MSINPDSRVGQIVTYYLTDYDVKYVRERRAAAGTGSAHGNDPHEGSGYPAIIVADWAGMTRENYDAVVQKRVEEQTADGWTAAPYESYRDSASVNLQVFLDGNDSFWATSRSRYVAETHMNDVKGHWVP